ncbi:MAG TPA: toprim domain-containing protein [Candidatus Thermoplasmatota archaeon]|nr:toprim domain-containing protein [Candidatus Thermoplasmatota archaeon]
MEADERYERLWACLEALRLDNHDTLVLVEGVRDERALRQLGVTGKIHVYNTGRSLIATAEHLVRNHKRVIALFDWDRTGGSLTRRLQEQLHAQVEIDLTYRKELAQVSQVRCVEDLPGALRNWARRAGITRDQTGDAEA